VEGGEKKGPNYYAPGNNRGRVSNNKIQGWGGDRRIRGTVGGGMQKKLRPNLMQSSRKNNKGEEKRAVKKGQTQGKKSKDKRRKTLEETRWITRVRRFQLQV